MKWMLFALLLSGCTLNVGPHVTTEALQITKYACQYSDHWFSWNRTIALCNTAEQCNAICEKLALK